MEFRDRDYRAEEEAQALPRSRADCHPLSYQSPSPSHRHQVDKLDSEDKNFFDPLRGPDANVTVSVDDVQDFDNASKVGVSSGAASQVPSKEWNSFKRFLMQRFPFSKMVSIFSMSDALVKSGKAYEKSSASMHLDELNDMEKSSEEDDKVITRQEYISRLHELKDEINRAWAAEDRVTSLKLSIKVARLLMDTSVLEFYPTIFVLVTEVMDMLGDLVWERIKQKAEFTEDETRVCTLSENFGASDICFDAKETCNNWFCKVGSVRELLPRIYLELAILPCWRFLHDRPEECLQRVVMMTRGLADPLASSYCRLYMVHCARKLPACDTGYLITCINDIKVLLMRTISTTESPYAYLTDNKKLLVSLMEPTIEYLIKCILNDASQRQLGKILVELGIGKTQLELSGSSPCISIILHHLLKELPTEVVVSNSMEIFDVIRYTNDHSFDQCLNYRLLGFKLSESRSQMEIVNAVVDKVIQVVTEYDRLEDYLTVLDAYMDTILQNQMDDYLNSMLEGIVDRACKKKIVEDELASLQSIMVKLISYFRELGDLFSLNHFLEILDVMYGGSRNVVNMHILSMAMRNGYVCDQTIVKLLFEVSRSLHDGMDLANMKDDESQLPSRLIIRFIQLVDYGEEMEQHLNFLVECRGIFGNLSDLKETLVHSSNALVTKALKGGKNRLSFVKSCVAFSEVTVPSISAHIRQLNLYLETAEVALLGGLVSHADGLIASAMSCLQSLQLEDGSQIHMEIDGILSSIRKLCSLLVVVPGIPDQGATNILKGVLSIIHSLSWMTPRMKTRIHCSLVLLSAALSQNKLPYHLHHSEVLGNDMLFFGDTSYASELISFSEPILRYLVDAIDQEPLQTNRGSMALEACNCIASSFKINDDLLMVCYKLIDTAKSCLSVNDKFLQSTIKFLDKRLPPPSPIQVN
ncbi:VPS35 endosomal protein sorting factor-like isoform X2 [Tripterygium wilfordii]|uniref:VPS35 endosomal protein sorting factor-like isoform X2 n=1 Tax=Tripterygium wilfordii TaxID=458696 RepID=UPI0018F831CF|nr:VPS35 endosomal protein sorting factor-like isoform X2 [Tripterygium wilfordii]